MKFASVIVLIVAFSMLVDHGDCWRRRRRRRRRSGGRWGVGNGGVTYTFRNGVKVTGYGSVKPKSVGIKVTIPFGRKRREVEEQQIPLKEDEEPFDVEEQELAALTMPQKAQKTRPLCAECVEVKPYKMDDTALERKTMANNDFVMVAKFLEENKSAARMKATIKFKVYKVLKSPVDTITAGEIFSINAKMASCPCLTSLEPGLYIVKGSVDKRNRLVLSNVLLEFQK